MFRIKRHSGAALLVVALASSVAGPVLAQGVGYQEEYAKLIKADQEVAPLTDGMFGDSVSLYNGSTEFVQTDVSLSGNSALPVAFSRRFAVENRGGGGLTSNRYALGDWDVELPYISAVHVQGGGWTVELPTGASTLRCSGPQTAEQASPPDGIGSGGVSVPVHEYWQAPALHVPGGGGNPLLFLTSATLPRPSDGRTYRWVTKDNWFLACASTITGGTGEGFIARSPDGLTYYFDHMVKLSHAPIVRKTGTTASRSIEREEVRLYATKVEDRFVHGTPARPNSVNYTWIGNQLQSISGSDGRLLTLSYGTNGKINSVSDQTRLWVYNYTTDGYNTLSSVILPDTSLWEFGLATLHSGATFYNTSGRDEVYIGPYCNKQRELPANGTLNLRSGTIRHPSGALATFTFDIRRHGRTEVPLICDEIGTDERFFAGQYPVQFDTLALVTKTLTGSAIPAYTWNYDYQVVNGSNCVPGQGCPVGDSTKSVSVRAPDGSRTVNTFGVRFGHNEGMLLGTKVYPTATATTSLREQSLAYLTPAEAASFQIPAAMGEVLNPRTDSLSSATTLPQKLRQTVQEGVTFTWQATAFDAFARQKQVQRGSTLPLGVTKTESTTYHDNYVHWVLGQVATVNHVFDATTSATMVQNTFDLATAQLLSESSWGKLRKSYTYAPDGTLASVTDGAGASHATVLSDYHRGVPRRVDYANAGEYETAQVNNVGRITHVRDERNYTTEFVYHPTNGKLSQVKHPQGDTVAWYPTTFDLEKIVSSDMGFSGDARWRQTIRTDNRYKEIHFDALLRPVVTIEWDAAAPTAKRYDVRRYDHAGREVFRSVPLDSMPANFATVSAGTSSIYDALGRVTSTTQTSELAGPGLTTSVSYLGFQRSVLDPRNRTTTTTFLAWDEPTYDYPLQIQGPEGLSVVITRDIWGKPTRVRRGATINGVSTSVQRRYVYDEHKRLCLTSENESGTTIIDYDVADNVLWRATGLPVNLGATQCDRSTVASTTKTSFGYDLRNRLLSTTPPAGTAAVTQTYYPDGSLWTLASNGTLWTYEYNGRGLVEKETLNYDSKSFVFDWAYDAQASVTALTYPDGIPLTYAPDALGRPTTVGSYVSGAKYHIDGALKEFDYANGFKHTLTQNARHLPLQSKDMRNGVKVVDLTYSYDENANVTGMVDGTSGALETKQLVYDGLNRLTGITNWPLYSPVSFEYDPFDNLRRLQVGSRVMRLAYDATTNRPYAVQNDAGVTQQSLTYDARGNLQSKGTQTFTFDAVNRLTTATPVSGSGNETYVYDGHGRRVSILRTGQNRRYAVYTLDGKLRYEIGANGEIGKYAYLGNSLVARSSDAPAQTQPPATPAPLTSDEPYPSTDGLYTLNWSSVANVARYDLEETVPGGGVSVIDLGLATSWTTSSARPAGDYSYRARACNAAGCSNWTGAYGIRVQYSTPPAAPNPLTASPNPSTTGAFTVSWADVGAASYRLEETTGGNVVVRYSNGTNTSWPTSGRAIGSYDFVAYACNSSGQCAASFPLTVSVQEDPSVPAPPSSISASPDPSSDGLYAVQWSASAGADHYKLYEEANGIEQGVIYSGASTSWSINPATPRVTGDYRYWVKACKTLTSGAVVCSTDSSAFTEHVRLPGVPTTPAWISLSPTAGNNQVVCNGANPRSFTVYWAASSGPLHHYEVIESNHVNSNSPVLTVSPPTVGAPSLSLSRSKIPPDSYTTYQYEVRACNETGGDAGCSGWRGVAEMCVGNSGGNGPFSVASTTYYHTDALGSPVAKTNAKGSLDSFSRYEPYGLPADGTFPDSPGYTGHVADSFTQLSYMQQRYYDPMMGRFLSVDPVATVASTGSNFNRYWYSDNNPYTYVDPDGEAKTVAWLVKLGATNMRKVARLSQAEAVKARRAGDNVLADSKQRAKQIEEAAHGKEKLMRHAQPHRLDDGSYGLPHYQTNKKLGHTYWSVVAAVAGYTADALDNAAEAAEYLPDGIRPATRDDLDRTNGIIDLINESTGLEIPKYDQEKYGEDEFGGVYRVDGRLGSKRLDEQLKEKD